MPSWKKVILSGSDAALNSLNVTTAFTASGLNYPTIDGEDGQALVTDGDGLLSFQDIKVYTQVKNISGGTLQKGTPVHATASASPPSGNLVEVIAASASLASSMPATFVLDESLTNGQEGRAISVGRIGGVNTSGFTVGDIVYVGVNGGYTNIKPTGSTNFIQNLGIVTRVDATNGAGFIYGSGRSNDIPNIPQGFVWIGNANGVATAVATSSIQNVVSSSFASTASFLGSTTNGFIQNGNSFGTTATLGTNDNQSLQFETNGTTKMFISSSGNVGIGTTSPGAKLQVAGDWTLGDVSGGSFKSYTFGTELNISGLTAGGWARANRITTSDSSGNVFFGVLGNDTTLTRAYWTVGNPASIDATGFNSSNGVILLKNGNVGIGTTSPVSKLTVTTGTDTAFSDGALKVIGDIALNSANNLNPSLNRWSLRARPSNIEGAFDIFDARFALSRLLINSSGNVGIGTTSPSAKLHVAGGGGGATSLTDVISNSIFKTDYTGNPGFGIYMGAIQSGGGAFQYIQSANTTPTAYNLVLNPYGGNVGIGTTAPSALLHLKSDFSSGVAVIYDRTQNANIDSLFYTGVSTNGATTSDFMWMGTSTSDMTITGAGNVGIGTTSPATKLHIFGPNITTSSNTVAQSVLRLTRDITDPSFPDRKDSAVDFMLSRQQAVGNNFPYTRFDIRLSGTTDSSTPTLDVMSLLYNGNVGIGTTSPNAKLDVQGTLIVSSSILQYSNNASITSGSTANVASFSTGSYTAGFFDYVATSGTNARAGTVFTVWNANNVEFTETSTNDIGSTSNLILSASLSAGAIQLQATSLTGTWSVKTLARMI